LADSPALDLCWRSGAHVPSLCELLHAALDDFEPQAILEHESETGWRVHFRTALQRDAAATALLTSFGNHVSVDSVDVEDERWARRSQAELKAVSAGRIVVAPPWDACAERSGPDRILIVIEPSTGFGTGHHETTRLCLRLMQDIDLTGRRVIDVGTGSGILALAAWKLGASSIVAFDEDADALDNARENIGRNHAAEAIEVHEARLGSATFEPADVVVANLTSGAIEKHAGDLCALIRPGGTLIVSGFSPAELSDVARALNLDVHEHAQDAGWAAASFKVSHPQRRS
jgi:ribosomal protein L11 methyltransferase